MTNNIYYAIVEKSTGVMEFGRSNFIEHTERPLHQSLAYAPLNDELVRALVPDDLADHDDLMPIDFTTSYWDFKNTRWVLFYDVPNKEEVDPFEEAIKIKQRVLREAAKKLAMPDISPKYKQKIEEFVDLVNSIDVTPENVLETAALLPNELPLN